MTWQGIKDFPQFSLHLKQKHKWLTSTDCDHTAIRKIVAILGPDQTAVQNCRFWSQEGSFRRKEGRTKEIQKTIPAEISYNDKCFLLRALKQSVLVPCVHACIFSWHNWAIRVTLMHHIYLLFITGRICPDWPRIFLWQLFSQLLFWSILEFRVFSFVFIPPQ